MTLEEQKGPSPLLAGAVAAPVAAVSQPAPASEDALAATINTALGAGDSASVVDALGSIARARGMTQVAKEAGLARESLYRSLRAGGNPEFGTVLKVMAILGLRLEVSKVQGGGA